MSRLGLAALAFLLIALIATGAAAPAFARPAPRLALAAAEAPPYVPPGANVAGGAPASARPDEGRESVTSKWWFWTAIGAVIATTVVVVLVAGKAPSPPDSNLGNMDAFGSR